MIELMKHSIIEIQLEPKFQRPLYLFMLHKAVSALHDYPHQRSDMEPGVHQDSIHITRPCDTECSIVISSLVATDEQHSGGSQRALWQRPSPTAGSPSQGAAP